MNLDFKKFNTGTLFLCRTPETFPAGYAEESFKDMKENLDFDFAALLETWNCNDGVLWKTDKFPRSPYWQNEERDPVEECFAAADKYNMAYLPEAGVMHNAFAEQHKEGYLTKYTGETSRYSRIGLTPACPDTLEYFIEKYDTMLDKFRHHKSCQGICLPCENGIHLSYDKYTREAFYKHFGFEMPSPEKIAADENLEKQVFRFLEDNFLTMYRKLAKHLKQKYNLPLMHYPLDTISIDSFFQPAAVNPARNLSVMTRARELDMLNVQFHPPLYPNPYYFKMKTEYLMANSDGIPCMGDTHFYHEMAAGRLPDTTPKRIVDSILSTLTPYGISFFCYGFMAEELPLWKTGLKPSVPVYKAYSEPNTLKARREMCIKSMNFVEQLRPMLENTKHTADCAIFYPEKSNDPYMYSSYATEHIFGLHELFNAASIPVKITATVPEDSKEIKALILDSVKEFTDTEAETLNKYVKNGGKVIVIGKCCDIIEQTLNIKVTTAKGKVVQSKDSKSYNRWCFRLPLDSNHYTEANGEALLSYDSGLPAVTKNGNILFFGASDEIDRFSALRDFALVTWWKNYFIDNGLNSRVVFKNTYVDQPDRHQFVSCDIYENENKKLLFVRNFGVEHYYSNINWTLPKNFKIVKALADGNEFTFENCKNLPSFEHFVAIYAEKE